MHDEIPAPKIDGWGAPSTPEMFDGNANWHSKTSEPSAGRSMSRPSTTTSCRYAGDRAQAAGIPHDTPDR